MTQHLVTTRFEGRSVALYATPTKLNGPYTRLHISNMYSKNGLPYAFAAASVLTKHPRPNAPEVISFNKKDDTLIFDGVEYVMLDDNPYAEIRLLALRNAVQTSTGVHYTFTSAECAKMEDAAMIKRVGEPENVLEGDYNGTSTRYWEVRSA